MPISHALPPIPHDIDFAIRSERSYQDQKWGSISKHPHSVMEWIAIMEAELAEAKEAWVKGADNHTVLQEITQLVATGVACMTQHGAYDRFVGRVADHLD